VAAIIVVVTCEVCGQSWQRRNATPEQAVECVFCGSRGRLQLGPVQSDRTGTLHAEARLHPARASAP